jgi:hypothetical protein
MELLSGESRESRAGGPVDHSADLVALQQAWRRMSEMINLGEARIHAAPSESPFKRLPSIGSFVMTTEMINVRFTGMPSATTALMVGRFRLAVRRLMML